MGWKYRQDGVDKKCIGLHNSGGKKNCLKTFSRNTEKMGGG